MKQVSYTELFNVATDTMEYGGSPMWSSRNYCKDNGFEWTYREQEIVNDAIREYNEQLKKY